MNTATPRAPFLDATSFNVAQVVEPLMAVTRPNLSARSPFLSVYEANDGETVYTDPVRGAFASLVNELHDEEFDEALHALQCRARAMHDGQLAAGKPRTEADRLVTQHFSQLIDATEAAVESFAREFVPREQAGIIDHEIDSFVDSYTPTVPLDPEFEQFVGSWVKKLGRAAKAAAGNVWHGLKKVALGPFFNQIRRVVRPLLKRVLEWAIGKLPVPLQPAAHRLAQKLGFTVAALAQPSAAAGGTSTSAGPMAVPDNAGAPVQPAAGDDSVTPQQELNEHIAAALLAEDEVELELESVQFAYPSGAKSSPVFAELDDARQRFIGELESLAADENAAPHIQQFLPALLPALRVGIRLAGRPRVVDFLANLLAGLISKLIGPEQAPALSKAIADAGLKLMTLEMSDEQAARLAPSAVAAAVEETIGRVASLPDEVLDNPELLEGYALEAFEQAAAANLPAVLSEATYRQRPDLLEAGVNAGWVLLPLHGPKRYKRCTRVFKVTVSPHLAEEVESFEGAPLADHLQDQLGVDEGEQVDGEMILYEALLGSQLADIARGERETLGAGLSDAANAVQLQLLTPQAAASLLGKPGLGRVLSNGFAGPGLAAGQRLFHLATGRRMLLGQGGHPRRRLHVNLTLDAVQDQMRVCVFLSEVKAQRLAARLRQATNIGLITATLQRVLGRRFNHIFSGQAPQRLRIVHAGMRPGQPAARAVQNLPPVVAQVLVAKLQVWLAKAFAEFAKSDTARIVAATEDASDGITLAFTLDHPPGLKALGQALIEHAAAGPAIANAIGQGAAPTLRVDVFAGHRCA